MGENGELRCTVTALQPQRGRLYKVTWDDGTEQEVYRPTWEAAGCGVGDSMTQEERELLLSRAAEERGREYALWLLSRRDYAETELKRKLRDKVGAEAADGASRRMTELGLVNDERYAVRLARELCLRKHYPRRRAAEALRQKGIDRETAEAAVEEVGSEDAEQALALLRKKCYTVPREEIARRKLLDSLVRYGFSYETAREAMQAAEGE